MRHFLRASHRALAAPAMAEPSTVDPALKHIPLPGLRAQVSR